MDDKTKDSQAVNYFVVLDSLRKHIDGLGGNPPLLDLIDRLKKIYEPETVNSTPVEKL